MSTADFAVVDFAVATELRDEVAATYSGFGNPAEMIAALRRSVVAVLVDEHRLPLVADRGGLSWILAFTSPAELEKYGSAHGSGRYPVRFATISGERLLEHVVPSCSGPTGVAVDVAGSHPMTFPPAAGIVPDAAVATGPRG